MLLPLWNPGTTPGKGTTFRGSRAVAANLPLTRCDTLKVEGPSSAQIRCATMLKMKKLEEITVIFQRRRSTGEAQPRWNQIFQTKIEIVLITHME